MKSSPQGWLFALGLGIFLTAGAQAEVDRRQPLRTPGLVLDTPAPTGATRSITFTRNGNALIAAGEDKVVRIWPFNEGKLDTASLQTLRWQTWHEWRGAIYTMALSPDPAQKQIAIAGYGGYTGAVAILDRETGKVLHGLKPPALLKDLGFITTALAFSPDGKELAIGKENGSVWIWGFTKPGTALRRLGSHSPANAGARQSSGMAINRVGLIHYLSPNAILSVAQDQRLFRWESQETKAPTVLAQLTVPNAVRFAISEKGQRLALSGEHHEQANKVQLIDFSGKGIQTISLPEKAAAQSLALTAQADRLAVSVTHHPKEPWLPQACEIRIYDLRHTSPKLISTQPADYGIDGLAFDPKGEHLAIAGGSDHQIVIVRVSAWKAVAALESPGKAIWSVAFSRGGDAIGFRSQRNPAPRHCNDWGAGNWKVFQLKPRPAWADREAAFRPTEPILSMKGWKVVLHNRRSWSIVEPSGTAHQLLEPGPGGRVRWIEAQDGYPRCYTFFQPPGEDLQLAIGHNWGISIFRLRPKAVERSRVAYGHGSPVTTVAPSPNHRLLLTGSQDQTISCCSTQKWSSHPELGARFLREGTRLLVGDVATGSPAWEAGLSPKDEILELGNGGISVPASKWPAVLQSPEPNRELYFRIKRREVAEPLRMITSVRQRPLWRFFPTKDGEWVLWRWRDSFYDCSARGDQFIGWQINRDIGDTPELFRAEKFRKNRNRPEKVLQAVRSSLYAPERASIPDLLPPRIVLKVTHPKPTDREMAVEIQVEPRGPEQSQQPQSLSLWINDTKWRTFPGGETQLKVSIPTDLLRSGKNRIYAKAFNRARARDDSLEATVQWHQSTTRPRIHGLFVGVADYDSAPRGPQKEVWTSLLFPVKDAQAMMAAWKAQAKEGLYSPGSFTILANRQVSRQSVLSELKRLKAIVKPDDRVVIFLAGHGWARPIPGAQSYDANYFAFACPTFDIARYEETGLSSETLYEHVVALPAQQLLLIDACHSGSIKGADYLRALSPEGSGPPVFSAAARDESAWEHPKLGHGVFTRVVLDALAEDFPLADTNKDKQLDIAELGSFLVRRAPEMLSLLRPFLDPAERAAARQTPQIFPNLTELRRIAAGPLARAARIQDQNE